MYRIFFTVIITVLAIVSLCFTFLKPQMHKTVMIYNSDYAFTENEKSVEKTTKPATVKTLPAQVPVTKKIEEVKYSYPQKSTPKVSQTVQPTKKELTPQKTVVQKIEVPKTVQTIVKQETQPVQAVVQEEEQTQEEIILWNRWRSNLQNQIMADVKLPIIPVGTIFKFSFDVDKYGRVSNVKTWSLNPNYTPYAIQYIAPVIRSYQGHAILDFPANSNRNSTTMTGGWKISQTAKTSTPEDYRDIEKVIK